MIKILSLEIDNYRLLLLTVSKKNYDKINQVQLNINGHFEKTLGKGIWIKYENN